MRIVEFTPHHKKIKLKMTMSDDTENEKQRM